MTIEMFNEVEVLGEWFVSEKTKGNLSPYVAAFWAGQGGNITEENILRVGKVVHYFKHVIALDINGEPSTKRRKLCHIFAKVDWNSRHPRETWFSLPIVVVDPLFDTPGLANFIPLSRLLSQCAVLCESIKFDYGEDLAVIAIPLKKKIC